MVTKRSLDKKNSQEKTAHKLLNCELRKQFPRDFVNYGLNYIQKEGLSAFNV